MKYDTKTQAIAKALARHERECITMYVMCKGDKYRAYDERGRDFEEGEGWKVVKIIGEDE